MKEINFITPIIVSIIFAILLYIFYLYKSENNLVMKYLSYLFVKGRYKRAEIQKDTRRQDFILLIILMILIPMLGLKLIFFTVVISDSMKPQFVRGDIILTQTINKNPQVGDIITFKSRTDPSAKAITHRIVRIDGPDITTKGDNNPFPDESILKEDIIAKTVVINNKSVVIKGVGALFILDFTKEGAVYKFGDKFEFFQKLFLVIRTWGYVITAIALIILIMSMAEKRY